MRLYGAAGRRGVSARVGERRRHAGRQGQHADERESGRVQRPDASRVLAAPIDAERVGASPENFMWCARPSFSL